MAKTDPPPPSPAPPVNVVRHIHLTEDELIERFRPIPNPVEPDARFDFGQRGCLFADFAGELDFLRRPRDGTVWTLTACNGHPKITDGMHYATRNAQLVTEMPCRPDIILHVPLLFTP